MKRTLQAVCLAVFAAQALVVGQGTEVQRVLAGIRTALGGEEKLAAVKTVAIEGQAMRPAPDGTSVAQDFEMAFELLSAGARFMKKEVIANLGGSVITRRSGFNDAELIEEVDTPPSSGHMRMMRLAPGGPMIGGEATPEQVAAQQAELLRRNRREFARIALGMFGTTTPAYPVQFVYAGQAESPEGKADVLDVKGTDGFTAKLFVDAKTHLPLMLTWMDKEPLRLTMGGGSAAGGSGSVRVVTSGGAGRGQSPEDAARMQEDMAARVREADAKRKTVEYRVFYADYKSFDGVRLPTRIQHMVDGLPAEEMTFEKVKVNGKIDASKFAVAK